VAKLWSGIITETITRHVVVQADTREEAAQQLAEGFIVYELQEWKEEQARRVTREFTKSGKKPSQEDHDGSGSCLLGCEETP